MFSNIKNKKIFSDFFLNILAASLLIMIAQLVIYPYLSRIMTAEKYGTILTIMAIANTMGVAFGNSLNDTRILMQQKYDEKKQTGDYNIIFVLVSLINVGIVIALMSAISLRNEMDIIACIIISCLVLFRAYYTVAYRIIINYKKFVYTSVFGVVGYLVGLLITHLTGYWYMPFIFGELFSCLYIIFTAHIIRDSFKFTPLFKKTARKYSFLFFATLLSSIVAYMDRFFLYPVIGSEQVAIFTVASYLGKTAAIVMVPVASVLLTYYAKEKSLSLNSFYKRTGLFVLLCVAFLLGIYLVGIPILRFLYPTIVDIAIEYFYIANLAVIINVFSNTIQPILLRYARSGWQPIIHGTYLALYIILGIVGMKLNGLMGFCFAILIVNSIKVIFMLYLSHKTLKRIELNEQ